MSMISRDIPPHPDIDQQLGMLLSALDDGTRQWRIEFEELGELSTDVIAWQPFSNAHSIGGVMLHIIEVEKFWIHDVAQREMINEEELNALSANLTNVDDVAWPKPPEEPMAWYWDQFEQVRARSRDLIKTFTDPKAFVTMTSLNRQFSLRWIVHHVVAHEAYHGGQAVLLGLMHANLASK